MCYMMPDLINVPVERLIKNLEALAEADPKSVETRFNLARAHAMAYALRTESAQVLKGSEDEEVWFTYGTASIPFSVKPTNDNALLKAAKEHLARAIERYEEAVKLAPDNLAVALGYAWCVEQSGQTGKAVEEYRKVVNAAWEKEKDVKSGGVDWYPVTAEAAGYLIPLLDKDDDITEIKELKARIYELEMIPRPTTPIVIPLRGNLAACDLEDLSANVAFDADGTGLQKRWTWISKDAGWLVYDPHHTGKAGSALQLFGGVTFRMFWENGYHALASLDDDCDGMLAGTELEGLAIWQDLNGNGICERGEVKPLSEWGIVAVSCRYVTDVKHPDRITYSPQGVYFRDGSSRPTYDIILRPAIAPVDRTTALRQQPNRNGKANVSSSTLVCGVYEYCSASAET